MSNELYYFLFCSFERPLEDITASLISFFLILKKVLISAEKLLIIYSYTQW